MSDRVLPEEFEAEVQVGGGKVCLVNPQTGEGVRLEASPNPDEWERMESVFGEEVDVDD